MKHKSYYWVKLSSDAYWEPARFIQFDDDQERHWELIGEDCWRDFSDVQSVGPELIPPFTSSVLSSSPDGHPRVRPIVHRPRAQ